MFMLNELLIKELSNQVEINTSDITNIKNGELLSTNEIKTNETFIDGKPIYRKMFYVSSLPDATATAYQHGISNVDNIWCDISNSFIDWKNNSGVAPLNYIGGTSFNSIVEVRAFTKTSFTIDTHSTNRSGLCGYVTLKYTKTTD
ncbi:MAG: hypothetical protein IJI43_01695 [Bacilli bacterium]|nr:hypothetical protein [Bacilli bacterium]